MVFFFNDTATTEIYTLSLHDALPISVVDVVGAPDHVARLVARLLRGAVLVADRTAKQARNQDRKSTRLNSSHVRISYAGFCLKKKNLHGPLRHRGTCVS